MTDESGQDAEALSRTISLVDYLADLTDMANRSPVHDILADQADERGAVIWVADLPVNIELSDDGGELLRVAPVPHVPPPPVPSVLEGRLAEPPSTAVEEPQLAKKGPTAPDTEIPPAVRQAFERYVRMWQEWAGHETARVEQRALYNRLEAVAAKLEQVDDEVEFVLGVGLLSWVAPDGRELRRHLLTAKLTVTVDRGGRITVRRADDQRHLEDRELLEGLEAYHPDRGRDERDALLVDAGSMISGGVSSYLADWLGLVLDVPFAATDGPGDGPLTHNPSMRMCPALLLRPRSSALLAETYRRISEALKAPGAQVPVGLAQVVVDTDQPTREQWLATQGSPRGDQLGDDPLFPLAANAEQRRVIELLRTETSVVVQGPPGTGKTHTIANLVSALLANGQRVLVTSQKDQALRVLREKIPESLRPMCVLLTGNGRDSRVELDRGIDALSTAVATEHPRGLDERCGVLEAERERLQREGAGISDRVRVVRAGEWHNHGTAVVGQQRGLYEGTLASIARDVRRFEEAHAWMPEVPESGGDIPPLDDREFAQLRAQLRAGSVARARIAEHVPDAVELPRPADVAAAVHREQALDDLAGAAQPTLAGELSGLTQQRLSELIEIHIGVGSELQDCGLARPGREWLRVQLDNRLARRHSAQRAKLAELTRQARALHARMMQIPDRAVVLPPVSTENIGDARRLLAAGREYADYLRSGGRARRVLPSRQQQAAAGLVVVVIVDGRPPTSADDLDAVVDRLDIEITAFQIASAWAMAGLRSQPMQLEDLLSEFGDAGDLLEVVERIGRHHDRTVQILREARVLRVVDDLDALLGVLDAAASARTLADATAARSAIESLAAGLDLLVSRSGRCSEIAALPAAVRARDVEAYEAGVLAVDRAREERDRARRIDALSRALRSAHPELFSMVQHTLDGPEWATRELGAAWGWSRARQFVQRQRDPRLEEGLSTQYRVVHHRLTETVAELAAVRALRACLERMTDDQIRALRTYRALSSKTGKKQAEFRRAAREAIGKARDAVPAWVVALPNLLENITAERDRFDVVIVDEASQVGIDALFLLWMAPRVIVIGDDKQCTPGASSFGLLDRVFDRNDEYLAGIDISISRMLTSKSHLYELMEARSGRDAVIGLREHFRCVPEIITWSSRQFYGDGAGGGGLIPLTERGADALEPLVVSTVSRATAEGRGPQLRNEAEAQAIVDALVGCLDDPAYAGATFGVVILQATARRHMALVERLIHNAIPQDVRLDRKISVGTAPMFQGDERDVIFLSMVVTERPHSTNSTQSRQAYNVAASRAKRQLRLFASLPLDELKPTDLRHSLMSYMLKQPSIYGRSPTLEEVSADEYCAPFESRLEQRVFRAIRARGFHVVPQHPLGTRRLDLVVAGQNGRIAVECDGSYWHSGIQREIDDARRDQELRRMGWTTVRVRESGFELDPDGELAPVWAALDAHGIDPEPQPEVEEWSPVELPEIDGEQVAS